MRRQARPPKKAIILAPSCDCLKIFSRDELWLAREKMMEISLMSKHHANQYKLPLMENMLFAKGK